MPPCRRGFRASERLTRTAILAGMTQNSEPAEIDVRADERKRIAALLRTVAAGRREYLGSFARNEQNPALVRQRETLEMESLLFEMAARITEGDDSPLYGLLPSWRWTDEMTAALYAKDGNRG